MIRNKNMLKKLANISIKSLLLLSCGQLSATTVTTAHTDFPLRVNDGLSIDSLGNIYASNVGDTLNNDFTEFSGTGLIKIAADGSISLLSDQMAGPLGNAVDSLGNVYVSNINDKTIKKVSPDGITTVFAQLDVYPSGIVIDNENNLLVASYNNNNITKVTTTGGISLYSSDEKLNGPVGIVFTPDKQLYVANYNDGNIYSVSTTGEAEFLAHVDGPDFFNIGYMTYASGNLYTSGIGAHKLYKISLDGEVTLLAGTGEAGLDDGDAITATFACPNGITADPYGDTLYWNEYCAGGVNGNGIIRSLRLQPIVSTIVDNLGILANDGVSVAPDGSVYISNVGNTLNDDYSAFDGTSIIKVAPDGTHSILTDQLSGPLGNAVDSNGNVIVANVNDTTIRSVASDGTVSTIANLEVMPAGIAIDSADNIFVASYTANQILRIDANEEVSVYSDNSLLNGPVGMAFDENSQLYVANYNDGDIFTVSTSGELTLLAHIEGPEFFTIGYITYASGYIYATGIGGHQIYRVSANGDVLAIAGILDDAAILDGEGDEAKFACPNGIAAQTTGNKLYISDYCSPNQLRAISLATATKKTYASNIAQADQFDAVESTAMTNNVLSNDDLGTISASEVNLSITVPASHGELTILGAEGISYIPNNGFTGVDSYSYVYTDKNNMTTKPVKVTLTVEPAPIVAPSVNTEIPKSKSSSGGSTGLGSILALISLALFTRKNKYINR